MVAVAKGLVIHGVGSRLGGGGQRRAVYAGFAQLILDFAGGAGRRSLQQCLGLPVVNQAGLALRRADLAGRLGDIHAGFGELRGIPVCKAVILSYRRVQQHQLDHNFPGVLHICAVELCRLNGIIRPGQLLSVYQPRKAHAGHERRTAAGIGLFQNLHILNGDLPAVDARQRPGLGVLPIQRVVLRRRTLQAKRQVDRQIRSRVFLHKGRGNGQAHIIAGHHTGKAAGVFHRGGNGAVIGLALHGDPRSGQASGLHRECRRGCGNGFVVLRCADHGVQIIAAGIQPGLARPKGAVLVAVFGAVIILHRSGFRIVGNTGSKRRVAVSIVGNLRHLGGQLRLAHGHGNRNVFHRLIILGIAGGKGRRELVLARAAHGLAAVLPCPALGQAHLRQRVAIGGGQVLRHGVDRLGLVDDKVGLVLELQAVVCRQEAGFRVVHQHSLIRDERILSHGLTHLPGQTGQLRHLAGDHIAKDACILPGIRVAIDLALGLENGANQRPGADGKGDLLFRRLIVGRCRRGDAQGIAAGIDRTCVRAAAQRRLALIPGVLQRAGVARRCAHTGHGGLFAVIVPGQLADPVGVDDHRLGQDGKVRRAGIDCGVRLAADGHSVVPGVRGSGFQLAAIPRGVGDLRCAALRRDEHRVLRRFAVGPVLHGDRQGFFLLGYHIHRDDQRQLLIVFAAQSRSDRGHAPGRRGDVGKRLHGNVQLAVYHRGGLHSVGGIVDAVAVERQIAAVAHALGHLGQIDRIGSCRCRRVGVHAGIHRGLSGIDGLFAHGQALGANCFVGVVRGGDRRLDDIGSRIDGIALQGGLAGFGVATVRILGGRIPAEAGLVVQIQRHALTIVDLDLPGRRRGERAAVEGFSMGIAVPGNFRRGLGDRDRHGALQRQVILVLRNAIVNGIGPGRCAGGDLVGIVVLFGQPVLHGQTGGIRRARRDQLLLRAVVNQPLDGRGRGAGLGTLGDRQLLFGTLAGIVVLGGYCPDLIDAGLCEAVTVGVVPIGVDFLIGDFIPAPGDQIPGIFAACVNGLQIKCDIRAGGVAAAAEDQLLPRCGFADGFGIIGDFIDPHTCRADGQGLYADILQGIPLRYGAAVVPIVTATIGRMDLIADFISCQHIFQRGPIAHGQGADDRAHIVAGKLCTGTLDHHLVDGAAGVLELIFSHHIYAVKGHGSALYGQGAVDGVIPKGNAEPPGGSNGIVAGDIPQQTEAGARVFYRSIDALLKIGVEKPVTKCRHGLCAAELALAVSVKIVLAGRHRQIAPRAYRIGHIRRGHQTSQIGAAAAVDIIAVALRQEIGIADIVIQADTPDIAAIELHLSAVYLQLEAARCRAAAELHIAARPHGQANRAAAAAAVLDRQLARAVVAADVQRVSIQAVAVQVKGQGLVHINTVRQRKLFFRRDHGHGAAVRRVFEGAFDIGIEIARIVLGDRRLYGDLRRGIQERVPDRVHIQRIDACIELRCGGHGDNVLVLRRSRFHRCVNALV